MSNAAEDTCDVTIIGAGLVGICCALSIVETGLSVQLIDRDEPGQGASYGNAGIISPWSIVPQSMPGIWKQIPSMLFRSDGPLSIKPSYLPKLIPWGMHFLSNATEKKARKTSAAMEILNSSNVDLYRKYLQGTGHEHLVQDSYYVHAFRDKNKANLTDLGYVIRAEKGANLEKVNAQELRDLEPDLSHDFSAAILIKGQARATSPGKIGKVLAQKAIKAGVKIIKANVESLTPNSSEMWLTKTDNGDYSSKKIVLSAGAWSMKLLKPLGVSLPLEAERGYHLEYGDPGFKLNNSVMDVDNMFVASSMDDGLRVAGTAEFAGIDAPPNQKRIDSLKKHAKSIFPKLNTENLRTWMGARPSMPDSLPVLGELPKHKGLFAAFGHSHYGLMMAPKTGQIISELLSNKPINQDLSVFDAARF